MHAAIENIPVELELGEIKTRGEDWHDQTVRYLSLPAGTDFTPLLAGLPDDRCQSPHYGYVFEGSITVRYADGTEEAVDVVYGWHVAEWNRRHGAPLQHMAHRHTGYIATYAVDPYWQGKTAAGEDVTLYGLEWVNPHPERAIRTIGVEAGPAAGDALLLLVAVTRLLAGGVAPGRVRA